MTTEQATKIIASIYEPETITLTDSEKDAMRIAGCLMTDRETEDWQDGGKYQPKEIQLRHRVSAIYAQARAWNWGEVTEHLEKCYSLLGAESPDAAGYDFHRGQHPIQVLIAAVEAAAD